MTFKTTFICFVIALVLLTLITHLTGYAAQQAALVAVAFVLRFLLMVFQETARNEEYLMFFFIVITLSFGGQLVTFDTHWTLVIANLSAIFVGYFAASYMVKLRSKQLN